MKDEKKNEILQKRRKKEIIHRIDIFTDNIRHTHSHALIDIAIVIAQFHR